MALVAMNDHVDGIEDLKRLCGYGLPKTYPVALNGLGEGPEYLPNPLSSFLPPIKNPAYTPPSGSSPLRQSTLLSETLSRKSSPAPASAEGWGFFNAIFPNTTKAISRVGASVASEVRDAAAGAQNVSQYYLSQRTGSGDTVSAGSPGGAARTGAGSGNTFSQVTDFINQITDKFLQYKASKPPKVVVSRPPPEPRQADMTTYLLIGGGVLAAGVFTFALVRASRK